MTTKTWAPAALAPLFLAAAIAHGATHEVIVNHMTFQPATLRIKTGDTVRWVNREKRTSHSVLFLANAPGPLRESERFFPDEQWEQTFRQPGTYPYICGPHPEMKGVIHVSD